MRVFDFDGTIYKGESLFDLYLFSVRYEPRVLKYIAPVAQCGIRYKTGRFQPVANGSVEARRRSRRGLPRGTERAVGGFLEPQVP